MARIVIFEPEADVRELLARIAERLGHEAVVYHEAMAAEIGEGDVLVLEPGEPRALEAVAALRRRLPHVPIVCVSIYPVNAKTRGLEPVAYVAKPFRLTEIEQALTEAVERAKRAH